jgi:multisubunit Na+/H+ antiporter MnhG subunit
MLVNKFFNRTVVTTVVEIAGAFSITVGVGNLFGLSAALILGGVFAMIFAFLADRS